MKIFYKTWDFIKKTGKLVEYLIEIFFNFLIIRKLIGFTCHDYSSELVSVVADFIDLADGVNTKLVDFIKYHLTSLFGFFRT